MSIWNTVKNFLFEDDEDLDDVDTAPIKQDKSKVAKKVDLSDDAIKETKEEDFDSEITAIDSFSSRLEKKQPYYDEEDFKVETELKTKTEPEQVLPEWKDAPGGYEEDSNSNKPYEGLKYVDKQVFRPTPIISPVYGILDKNYKKEDVVSKKEIRLSASSSIKPDIDTIREKAFGETLDLEEVIEVTEKVYEAEIEEEKKVIDLSEEEEPKVDKVSVGDAEEYFNELGLEYNIDYKDSSTEKTKKRRSEVVEEEKEEKVVLEEPQIVEDTIEITQEVKKPEEEMLDDTEENLFDLIESMYEEDK